METSEKTFRHSFGKVAVLALVILLLGFGAFVSRDPFTSLAAVLGFIIALFYVTSSVTISSDEVTTKGLLGSKSLRWSEIARISSFGETLQLHNYDEDQRLSIDSQLDGYPDILNIIFSKRPDLLDGNDDTTMSISWLGAISTLGVSLAIIAIGVFQFLETRDVGRIFSLIFFVMGVSLILKWLLAPKSLTLEGKTLTVGYWFKERSHPASDIDYISLEKQRTKNGYHYFAQINLISGKKIKLPAFKQGAQLTYQILKRWHKKAVAS